MPFVSDGFGTTIGFSAGDSSMIVAVVEEREVTPPAGLAPVGRGSGWAYLSNCQLHADDGYRDDPSG